MYKKTFLAMCAAAALLAAPLSSVQAKTYRVIFAGYFGPDHPNTLMMQHFKKEIEEIRFLGN